jgi:hypothetical protein
LELNGTTTNKVKPKLNIIQTIKQGNPFIQSTFKRKGKEYKLVHYIDENKFSKTISFPSDSIHLQSIFPETYKPIIKDHEVSRKNEYINFLLKYSN